ncbi:MAG: 1-(5-phosphoribosyl)-5-[(5-phosphoribosylamino)methylideneamino]imidazole-4-carboxamide isomerase [bacterium]
MEVIPAIDIIKGRCVRLTRGDFANEKTYSDNPKELVKLWEELGVDRIHIVDLDGARVGRPVNREMILDIAKEVNVPVEVGGGIRSLDAIRDYIENGIDRVVLGSIVLEDKKILEESLYLYQENITVSLDVREGRLSAYGWLKDTELSYIDYAKKLEEEGVKEFIYTNIERDGTLMGPDLIGLQQLINSVKTPIIASGGISSLEDIIKVKGLGTKGVIIGKALYEGRINLKEAKVYAH